MSDAWALYSQALTAPTEAKLRKIVDVQMAKLSEGDQVVLSSIAEDQQYMTARILLGGRMHGRKASTLVESLNGTHKVQRAMGLVCACLSLAEETEIIFEKHKKASSDAGDGNIPPVIMASLKKRLRDIPEQQHSRKSPTWVKVKSGKWVGHVHVRQLDTPEAPFGMCTCGESKRDHMPCDHMLGANQMLGREVSTIVPVCHQHAAWVAETAKGGITEDLPTMTEVLEGRKNKKLRVPVIAPPKRGRPATKRLRSAVEKVMGRYTRKQKRACNAAAKD